MTADRIELACEPPPLAGRFTTLRVRLTLGRELPEGAGLAVFSPLSFGVPQLTRPRFPGYVTARTSSGRELVLSPLKKPHKDHNAEYRDAVLCRAKSGALPAGETVEVVFGDTSEGSPGVRTGAQALTDMAVACYRLEGGVKPTPRLPQSPKVTVRANPAVLVRGFATPVLGAGETGRLQLVAEDEFGNRNEAFAGTVRLRGVAGLAGLPGEVRFTQSDHGRKELEFTATTAGIHHPVVSGPGGDLEAGPVAVETGRPKYRLYFGELHVHSELSSDATGTIEDLYGFAEKTACLDFAAASDHFVWAEGIPGHGTGANNRLDYAWGENPERWRLSAETVRKYHRPGRFVTFLGVEANHPNQRGHRNVYFRDDDVPLVEYPSWPPPDGWLSQWARANAGRVLVVPHHPPIAWEPGVHPEQDGDALDYGELPDELQPAVEIYSRHGTSEFLNNPRPLRGQIPGHFVQDMLAAGHRFGFIAGSDSHQANPGSSRTDGGHYKTLQYRSGLAAVWARGLTREAIWEAIFARRCFATTYPRFVLSFAVNGLFMGQAGPAAWPREVRVRLASPVEINEVEVIRNNAVVHTFVPGGNAPMPAQPEGELVFVDDRPSGRAEDFYYVRVTTTSGERAWASPVFARGV